MARILYFILVFSGEACVTTPKMRKCRSWLLCAPGKGDFIELENLSRNVNSWSRGENSTAKARIPESAGVSSHFGRVGTWRELENLSQKGNSWGTKRLRENSTAN